MRWLIIPISGRREFQVKWTDSMKAQEWRHPRHMFKKKWMGQSVCGQWGENRALDGRVVSEWDEKQGQGSEQRLLWSDYGLKGIAVPALLTLDSGWERMVVAHTSFLFKVYFIEHLPCVKLGIQSEKDLYSLLALILPL